MRVLLTNAETLSSRARCHGVARARSKIAETICVVPVPRISPPRQTCVGSPVQNAIDFHRATVWRSRDLTRRADATECAAIGMHDVDAIVLGRDKRTRPRQSGVGTGAVCRIAIRRERDPVTIRRPCRTEIAGRMSSDVEQRSCREVECPDVAWPLRLETNASVFPSGDSAA